MRHLIVFTLIITVLAQASVRTAWVLHYQWNLAAYLEKCENKAKPSLHCNGKCHLKKQIAASENQDPAKPVLPNIFHEFKDTQLFFEPLAALPTFTDGRDEAVALPPYRVFLPDAPIALIFRPPAA